MFTPGEPRSPEPITSQAEELGLVTRPPAQTIVRDEYTVALVGLVQRMLLWGGSRIFRTVRDVGTNEWQVISALANHPGATASDIIQVLGMNKSIASRSVNRLLDLELIAQLRGSQGSRHLFLTADGLAAHDELLKIAAHRQQILRSGLDDDEVAELNRLLIKLLEAEPRLQEFEQRIIGATSEDERAQLLDRTTMSANAARGR